MLKQYLSCLVLFITAGTSFGQSSALDSIQRELQKTNADTTLAGLLIAEGNAYMSIDSFARALEAEKKLGRLPTK